MTNKFSWHCGGKYCTPVQFTDNKLATQIVNSANLLAKLTCDSFQLQLSYELHRASDTRSKGYELQQQINIVLEDIRILAKGSTI